MEATLKVDKGKLCSTAFSLAQQLLAELRKEEASLAGGSRDVDTQLLKSLEKLIALDILTNIRKLISASSDINRLPTEILVDIFALVPRPWRQCAAHWSQTSRLRSDMISERMVDVRDLCPLTAVCHSWRRIVLGTPSLWSTALHCFTERRQGLWYKKYLHLCASVPLDVYIFNGLMRGTTTFLMEHGQRIRDLYLEYSPHTRNTKPESLAVLSLPMPALQHCAISGGQVAPPQMFPLFPNSDHLRTLHLDQCDFLPSATFPALTHFSISATGAPLHAVFTFLSLTPHLQVLKLDSNAPLYTYPGAIHLSEWQDRTVTLDRLRKLQITDGLPRLRNNEIEENRENTLWYNVLSRISFPPSCSVYVGALFLHHFSPTLNDLRRGRRVTHVCIDYGKLHGRLGTGSGFSLSALNPEEALDISVSVLWQPPTPHTLTTHFTDTLSSFVGIRRLWLQVQLPAVNSTQPAASTETSTFLPPLPQLEFLALFGQFEHGMVECYSPDAIVLRYLSIGPDGVVPSPALSVLATNLCKVGAGGELEGLYALLELVRSRLEAGSPVSRLSVIVTESTSKLERAGKSRSGSGVKVRTTHETYNAVGDMIDVDDCPDPYKRLRAEWAEGTEWTAPEAA